MLFLVGNRIIGRSVLFQHTTSCRWVSLSYPRRFLGDPWSVKNHACSKCGILTERILLCEVPKASTGSGATPAVGSGVNAVNGAALAGGRGARPLCRRSSARNRCRCRRWEPYRRARRRACTARDENFFHFMSCSRTHRGRREREHVRPAPSAGRRGRPAGGVESAEESAFRRSRTSIADFARIGSAKRKISQSPPQSGARRIE
jgi:hypothetical protein